MVFLKTRSALRFKNVGVPTSPSIHTHGFGSLSNRFMGKSSWSCPEIFFEALLVQQTYENEVKAINLKIFFSPSLIAARQD